MKELVKPNKKEEMYDNAEAYCEVYNVETGRYYTRYARCAVGACRVYEDIDGDDILF